MNKKKTFTATIQNASEASKGGAFIINVSAIMNQAKGRMK